MNCRRKYAVNDTFFDRIDRDEKAYWLGFLTSDGYIYSSPRGIPCGVSIALSKKDRGHLLKWRRSVGSTHPTYSFWNVRNGIRHPEVRINIGSMRLVSALLKLGITPAKSLTIKPCRIATNLERHYWRGVFDGDGCLHRRSDRRRWSLDLSGTWDIVEGFRQFVLWNGIKTDTIPIRAGKIWRFQVSGVALPRQVAKLLYDRATIYLDRKFSQYLSLAAEKDTQRRTGEQGWLAAKEAYDRLGNWKTAAEAVGIPWRTVYRLKKKWEVA